jgi:hypothetical protein
MAGRTAGFIVGVSVVCCGASAQVYEAAIDTKISSTVFAADTLLSTAGSLMGDYDAKTNPSGTQTRPGLFGGSGNNAIPASVDLMTTTDLGAQPAGGFGLEVDFEAMVLSISGLSLDLLNGSVGATDLSATLEYSTFNTIAPSFIYPGGIPLTLPLGEIGAVSAATVTQSGDGLGVLIATADPDVFDFTALVTGELSMVIALGLPGSEPVETPIDALPIALPLSGQIERLAGGVLRLTIVVAEQTTQTELPIDGVALPALPLELPTLSAATAGVVLSLAAEGLTFSTTFGLTLVANAEAADCAADFNSDGLLDFFDVSAFLAAFSAAAPSADLNNDSMHDFFDVQLFLAAFSAGC